MKKVRTGVFETNSSSTHSICIAKSCTIVIPPSLHLGFGEFGWEIDTHYDATSKASYLYTGLACNDRMDDIDKLVTILESNGVSVSKEEPDMSRGYFGNGYVDHSDELVEFLDAVMTDEEVLIRFLFADASFVETGNDNDDEDLAGAPDDTHDTFYKGN